MLRTVALCWLTILAGCSRSAPTAAVAPPRHQRPAWLKQGIVMAGNWETLGHSLRSGLSAADEVEEFKAERTEEVARKLKDLGVTLVTTSFYKGGGMKTEADEIEATRQFTQIAHRVGLKVGGYVGGTLLYETLYLEKPEARDWRELNEWGNQIYYPGGQTHRVVPCRNNPGYQAFVKDLIRLGVEDVKLDLIHFDQMGWWIEPRSCHCKYCAAGFRQFIRARYSDAQLKERYGFSVLDGVIPPPFDLFEPPVRIPELINPLMQDWAYYRSASMGRIYGEYDDEIGRLNPEAATDGNPFYSQGSNNGFQSGTDLSQYLQHGDVMWTEDGHHASWTADGRLISKIRTFKQARKMGRSVFMYTGGGQWGVHDPLSPHELRLAEAMAYNDMNLGMVGHVTREGVDLTPPARRYIDFFHGHTKDLVDTESVADAAVLRSFASVEFHPSQSFLSTFLFEQTLIQTKVPFDIIFDQHLKDLKRYKVLVLADQDALSDEQAGLIRDFVREGGGLVATGNTSLLNDWRRERRKLALADVLGMDRPGGALQREFGKGRVAYIPRVEPSVEPPRAQMSYFIDNSQWKLPKNYAELAAAVKWAAGGQLTSEVQAPLSVTAELAAQQGTNTWLLHLVNYDKAKPVGAIPVSLRIPAGLRVREAAVETPDGAARRELAVRVSENTLSFTVPDLKVYDLVLLRFDRQ